MIINDILINKENKFSDIVIENLKKLIISSGLDMDDKLITDDFSKYLIGDQFDSIKYTEEEQLQFLEFTSELVNKINRLQSQEKPKYIATAGAPLSGKSFLIEKLYEINVAHKILKDEKGEIILDIIDVVNAVDAVDDVNLYLYIDPDRSILPNLPGYEKTCQDKGVSKAYEIYRNASNFVAAYILNVAVKNKLNIIHGTTSQSIYIRILHENLKKQNYLLKMHLVLSNNDDREIFYEFREKVLRQTQVTIKDILNKSNEVLSRIGDMSYSNIEEIHIYVQNHDKVKSEINSRKKFQIPFQDSVEKICIINGSDYRKQYCELKELSLNTIKIFEEYINNYKKISNSPEVEQGINELYKILVELKVKINIILDKPRCKA